MADSKSTHQIEISAIDKATQVINGIDNRFKSLGKTIDKALAVVGVAGVAALTGALTKAVKEAAAEEQTMKRLSTAIEATGKSYLSVSGQVNTLLKSQQNLTQFADDQSAGALATLIQLTQNYDLSMKALVVTEDLAASGLFDLDSASTAVGKALTGNVMLLQRMGIKLKEGDDVLAALSARFGGTAAKNVDTFSGRLTQLKNTISDAFEAVGGPMLEPLKKAAETLRATIASPEMQKKIEAFAKSIADMIPKAVSALTSFSSWVVTHGETILNFFKALIALRIVSWATSAAAALVTLAPAISTALAAAISPAGLIVLAAASGTAIGLTIGHAIAKAIRDSRKEYQSAIPDVLNDFVGPPAMAKFPLVGSGLNAQNLGTHVLTAGDGVVAALEKVAYKISNIDNKVLGSRLGRGVIDPLIRNERGLLFPEDDRNQSNPFRIRQNNNLPTVSRSDIFGDAEERLAKLQEQINMLAPALQFAMSTVMDTLVRGFISGKGQIVDVLNSLRDAILSILAQIAARMATAGLLSLIPGVGGFASVFNALSGGQIFNQPRPAPVGASPSMSGFGGGGVTIVFQGDVYGSADSIASHIESKLANRMRMGTSRMIRGNG